MSTKNLKIIIPTLHPRQTQVVSESRRFNVLACGRRWGKSKLLTRAVFHPMMDGYPVGWFAPNYKFLAEAWRDLRRILLPVTSSVNKQERRIELTTGGSIDFWSLTDEDAGRSYKYKRVAIDEAGLVKTLGTAWNEGIRPTLTDMRGDAWFGGTPKGRGYFWDIWNQGQDALVEDWASWQMPTITNSTIPDLAAEIEAARNGMPERSFQQEYLAEFMEDGGGVFRGVKAIVDPGRNQNEEPVKGRRYTTGVDLARVNDFTVITTLDAETGRQVYHERFNQISWELQIARILNAARKYPGVVIMDSTGVGDPLYEQVRKQLDPRSEGRVDGYNLTAASKEALIDRLAIDIENQTLRLLGLPVQTAELQAYQYEVTASRNVRMNAPPGMHDDTVIALALANWGRSRKPRPKMRVAGIG